MNNVVRPAPNQQGGEPRLSAENQQVKQVFFSYTSEFDGKVYEGQFTFKRLSVRDECRVNVRKVQLNGGMHYDANNPGRGIDEVTETTNHMIAWLEHSIIQAPMWFNLDELYEAKLLADLFREVVDFQNSFFRSIRDRNVDPGSGTKDSSTKGQGPNAAGHIAPMGRGEVPTTLDP